MPGKLKQAKKRKARRIFRAKVAIFYSFIFSVFPILHIPHISSYIQNCPMKKKKEEETAAKREEEEGEEEDDNLVVAPASGSASSSMSASPSRPAEEEEEKEDSSAAASEEESRESDGGKAEVRVLHLIISLLPTTVVMFFPRELGNSP